MMDHESEDVGDAITRLSVSLASEAPDSETIKESSYGRKLALRWLGRLESVWKASTTNQRHLLSLAQTLEERNRVVQEIGGASGKIDTVCLSTLEAQSVYATSQLASTNKPGTVLLQSLRDDLEAATSELTRLQGQEVDQDVSAANLTHQRDELMVQRSGRDEGQETVRRQLASLKEDVEAKIILEADGRQQADRAISALRVLTEHLQGILEDIGNTKVTIREVQTDTVALEGNAEKARRGADMLVNTVSSLQAQDETLTTSVSTQDAGRAHLEQTALKKEEHIVGVKGAVEKARRAILAKAHAENDLARQLEVAKSDAENIYVEQVSLDLELHKREELAKREVEACRRQTMERDAQSRRLRRAEQALHHVQAALPSIQSSKNGSCSMLAALHTEARKLAVTVTSLKQDTDIIINAFLREEQKGEGRNSLHKAGYACISTLEEALKLLRTQEMERCQATEALLTDRNRLGRVLADRITRLKQDQQRVAGKAMIIKDLKSCQKAVAGQTCDFLHLYQLLKKRQNGLLLLTKVAGDKNNRLQEIAKCQETELQVLNGALKEKEGLHETCRKRRREVNLARDACQEELNRVCRTVNLHQECIGEERRTIQHLGNTIKAFERDAEFLNAKYDKAVGLRNSVGLMLIERNDELCILQEKLNMLEGVLTKGLIRNLRLDKEIRLVKINLTGNERSIRALKPIPLKVNSLDELITAIKMQVLQAERDVSHLALKMELPSNESRWRPLEGEDLDHDELASKIAGLQARLSSKTDIYNTKCLMLIAMGERIEGLRATAITNRPDAFALAQELSQKHTRIMTLTRQVKAVISELSLLHASSLRLTEEKKELMRIVTAAQNHEDAGEPPTDDAETLWERCEFARQNFGDLRRQADELRQVNEARLYGAPSTAEPRPHAYIPSDLAIPKPFGAFTPFKPAPFGAIILRASPLVVQQHCSDVLSESSSMRVRR